MTGRPPAASPIAHPSPLGLQTYTKNVILLPSAQKKSRLRMNADGNVGGNVGKNVDRNVGGNVDGVAGNIVDGVANPRLPHLTKHVHTDSRKTLRSISENYCLARIFGAAARQCRMWLWAETPTAATRAAINDKTYFLNVSTSDVFCYCSSIRPRSCSQ